MLARLGKAMRWRAAVALAVLYALCVVTPSVALALSGVPAHCLTDAGAAHVHKRSSDAVTKHIHGDGTEHSHGAKAIAHKHSEGGAPHDEADADSKPATNCCGLFCATGIAQLAADLVATPMHSKRTVIGLVDVLTGRAPDRITRPPIR